MSKTNVGGVIQGIPGAATIVDMMAREGNVRQLEEARPADALHDRAGFEDHDAQNRRRLLYPARFLNRIDA